MAARLFSFVLCWCCLLAAVPAVAQGTIDRGLDASQSAPMAPLPSNAIENPPDVELRQPRAGRHLPTHFEIGGDSDRQDLTLYLEKGVNPILGSGGAVDTRSYVPLCSPPCEFTLRSRSYVFAVTAGDGAAVKVSPALSIREGDRVFVEYQSRKLLRISGWVLLVVGAGLGGVLLAAGFPASGDKIVPRIASGAAIMGVSVPFGLWFANMSDRARAWAQH